MDLALKSDLFLAPSVTAADGDAEGTPFVLQQMIATGMPAIATTHTDIPYLFGVFGDSLVPERDVPAIARRLQHYAENPGALTNDGMALRARIRERFAARECAGRLADLYDEVSPKQ
jgi:colanic acid/amylovoran biosynthesis glycosyltransferase